MSPNAIVVLCVGIAAVFGLIATLPFPAPRNRFLAWLRIHSETCAFALILGLALSVLGPTLDRHALALHEARMAQR